MASRPKQQVSKKRAPLQTTLPGLTNNKRVQRPNDIQISKKREISQVSGSAPQDRGQAPQHIMRKAEPKKKLKIRLKDSSAGILQRSAESDQLAEKWPVLERAIRCIYESTRTESSLEELYRITEELCATKKAPDLYALLRGVLDSHIKGLGQHVVERARTMGSESLLIEIKTVWLRHCADTTMIRQVVLTLDRSYALEHKAHGVLSVWELGLQLFGQHVMGQEETGLKVLEGLILTIERERKGESVDRDMLQTLLKMYAALGLYESVFEPELVRVSRSFYTAQGQEKINAWETPEFLQWVAERLQHEAERVTAYMQETTKRPLIETVEETLLSAQQLETIVDKGFDALLDEQRMDDLALMYRLFERVDALGVLDVAFNSYVKRVGVEIVADKERDKTMVQDLLDFKSRCSAVVVTAFRNNVAFYESEKSAFEHFINVRANKPAELIAKFIDAQLKSSKLSEDEVDELLTRVMVLFRFINGKDVFEAFYKKDLAKRLLLGRSASMDWEKLMITKLKTECGSTFTTKLEGMFRDLDTSHALMADFNAAHADKLPVIFNLNVLTSGYWPEYVVQPVTLPDYLQATCAMFEEFYSKKHEARRLTWHHSLAYVSLNAFYPKKVKKQFHVSLFQAVVLLLFNDDDTMTLEQIEQRSGLEKAELVRTLKSLSMGKVRVLSRRKADGVEQSGITGQDTFSWKADFKHKMMRIKINTIQVQETVEESDQVREAVMRDRQYQIDAAIVRIMKMRRSLAHSQLVSELYNQLKFPIKPAEIKRRIESLLDRGYLERHADNSSIFVYKA